MKSTEVIEIVMKYVSVYDQIRRAVSPEHIEVVMSEIGKEIRMTKFEENETEEPATEPQLKLLKKLGVDAPVGLTKKRASQLIDDKKSK